jgi:hypothetical protein
MTLRPTLRSAVDFVTAPFSLIVPATYGLLGLTACGGSTPPPKVPEVAQVQARAATPLARKACAGDGEASVDIGGNGKAAVRHAKSGGKVVCSELDLNLDGHVDLMRKMSANGQVELEQHDLDFDGRLDQEAFFEKGALARKELDTNFDRWIDTWVFCDGPFIAKLERDRHRVGKVDTWEEYTKGQLTRVRYDDDGDGRVERWELYRNGKLYEIAYDPNTDGVADRTQRDMPESGVGVDAVSCNGFPLPPAPEEDEPPALPPSTATSTGAEADPTAPIAPTATEPPPTPAPPLSAPAPKVTAPTTTPATTPAPPPPASATKPAPITEPATGGK